MIIVPLVAAMGGSALTLIGSILMATDSGLDIAPYATGAGSGIMGLAIVWVLKAVLDGRLVARPVIEVEAKLFSLVESGQQREKFYEGQLKRRTK